MRYPTTLTSLLLAAALAAACGDDSSGGGDAGTDSDTDTDTDVDTDIPDHDAGLAGPCDFDDKVGWFKVEHHDLYSAVTGEVSDGVVPAAIPQSQEIEGDCILLQKLNPVCDPPCEPGFTCDFDGECIPYPSKLHVGAVVVEGLTTEVVMTPNGQNDYFDTSVDSPPFTDGSEITLGAAGNETEAFALDAFGVEVLAMPDNEWIMFDGEPLEIFWTPSDGEGRILATFNVDQHGNSPMTMVCDLDDTGTATVPAGLIGLLFDYGISGFASGHLYRRTIDSTQIDVGCVELEVFSHQAALLSVGN
ncbi:MAG: hypothetical protein JRF63_05080 [Deltaproteobacteria bacterium]|nr:hypothetical protein [Deltaproteobacteria bacterium]